MIEIQIFTNEKGAVFFLNGRFQLALNEDQYKELILVDNKNLREKGYTLQYQQLRCWISSETAKELIDLGATVQEYLP